MKKNLIRKIAILSSVAGLALNNVACVNQRLNTKTKTSVIEQEIAVPVPDRVYSTLERISKTLGEESLKTKSYGPQNIRVYFQDSLKLDDSPDEYTDLLGIPSQGRGVFARINGKEMICGYGDYLARTNSVLLGKIEDRLYLKYYIGNKKVVLEFRDKGAALEQRVFVNPTTKSVEDDENIEKSYLDKKNRVVNKLSEIVLLIKSP